MAAMKEKHEICQLKTNRDVDLGRLGKLLAWADIAYYEWCDDLLHLGTQLRPDMPTVARLHRFELYSGVIHKIDWSCVDLVINNISHPYIK